MELDFHPASGPSLPGIGKLLLAGCDLEFRIDGIGVVGDPGIGKLLLAGCD